MTEQKNQNLSANAQKDVPEQQAKPGSGGHIIAASSGNLADARLVQKALIGTKIPIKRSFVQRQQNRTRRSAAYRDDESDDPDGEDRRTTKANEDGDQSDQMEPPDANKRQKTRDFGNEYDSPDEDAQAGNVIMTEERAKQLQDTVSQSITESAKVLPIFKHKAEIITKLDRNRVVIISGDTGCGKTTQVPKYILETGLHRQQDVKIICTQPRRLAAVNIARRVASELKEKVGQTVGFQVGMQRKKTPGVTRITFMTTGIFLMRLVNNPDSLKSYTHLIMDEVHERDLDIDFSLVVVKHLLGQGEQDGLKFKLILMSATFNTNLFANYFASSSVNTVEEINAYEGADEAYQEQEKIRKMQHEKEWGPCRQGEWDTDKRLRHERSKFGENVTEEDQWIENKITSVMELPVKETKDKCDIVEINARMFEVREFYLDQVIKNIQQQQGLKLTSQDKEILMESLEGTGTQKPTVREGAMRAASIIICDIISEKNMFNDDITCPKSVLVFLPGLSEIFQFMDYLREFYTNDFISRKLELIPLHSSLNEEEQDRAFKHVERMQGKRKVIIATNIAESSITIPDVKYVIDFCLTKELHYDPVSKSESLQLNWCSRASAKQRMGRAGRVSEGIVFRLCSEKFFENFMPEYPKPEMQRCPLEKLILQIKLWNRYEPDEILGRAIQPPELRDIYNAIKNLQQTGALTIPPPILTENGQSMSNQSEKYKPKITALGKIFVNLPVDLKITRIFLFGMALKCMQQAINIGAIHSQTRSIFRVQRSADPVNVSKLQCMYDEKRDSDSLMLLRVYQEWIHKFHPYLKHRKEDEEQEAQQRDQQQRNRGDGKRVFIRRPLISEKKWCQDRGLDNNILREVATLAEEIRHRFIRMNISLQCLNSKVRLRDDNPDAELILKICIGGAFYSKYVKAAYKNEDMLMRMKNHKFFDHEEAKNSLILNKVSEHITESHLRQFFEGKFKVPVTKVSVQSDKPTIVFGPELLERGFLKACFRLGLRNRFSRYRKIEEKEFEESKQFRSSILSAGRARNKQVQISYDEAREKLENEELRRPNYLYELRYETINKESYVDFDMDSINNFTMETDTSKLPHITYACQEYYDKGGRFLCRNSTKLPDVPMVDAIFCLIFAPVVQVMADENKVYFNKLVCDNGELVLPLTHILTHYDLELAQRVRNMLNESLCDEVKQKQAHLGQVDFYVKKLLGFKRISVDIYVKLQALKEEDALQDNKKLLQTLNKKIEDEENFFLTEEDKTLLDEGKGFEDVTMNDEGEIIMDRQARYEEECEKGYFLQPIYVQKISTKIYLYDEKVRDLLLEFQERIQRKRNMIDKNKLKCKEFALRDTMVICERCKSDLAPLKTFDYESHELHYAKCVFGAFRKVTIEEAMTEEYAEDREFVELYKEVWEEENQLLEPGEPSTNYSFCECRKQHIVGIIKDQKYYLTEISQVQIMFPGGVYDRWEEHLEPGYKKAFSHQDKLNYQRVEVIKHSSHARSGQNRNNAQTNRRQHQTMSQPVQCELCQVTLDDPEEFIGHCRKDPIHLALQTKFTDETYDFLFDESQFGELSGGQGLQANPSSTTVGPSTTMISTTGNQNNNYNNHSQRGGSSYGGGGGYGGYGGRSNYNNSNYNNGGGHQHNQRY